MDNRILTRINTGVSIEILNIILYILWCKGGNAVSICASTPSSLFEMMRSGVVSLSFEVMGCGAGMCWGWTVHWGWLSAVMHKSDRGGSESPGTRPPSPALVPSFSSPLSLSLSSSAPSRVLGCFDCTSIQSPVLSLSPFLPLSH